MTIFPIPRPWAAASFLVVSVSPRCIFAVGPVSHYLHFSDAAAAESEWLRDRRLFESVNHPRVEKGVSWLPRANDTLCSLHSLLQLLGALIYSVAMKKKYVVNKTRESAAHVYKFSDLVREACNMSIGDPGVRKLHTRSATHKKIAISG